MSSFSSESFILPCFTGWGSSSDIVVLPFALHLIFKEIALICYWLCMVIILFFSLLYVVMLFSKDNSTSVYLSGGLGFFGRLRFLFFLCPVGWTV